MIPQPLLHAQPLLAAVNVPHRSFFANSSTGGTLVTARAEGTAALNPPLVESSWRRIWDLLSVVAVERSFRKLARTSLRCAVGWLLLGIVLISLIGVPVPQRKRAAADAPFPCQDRPCGCGSAEACWRQCCCFSDSEKLVWAREHGVTPPEYVVRAALASQRRVSQQASPLVATNDPSGCGDACCSDSETANPVRPSCCSEPGAITAECATGAVPAEAAPEAFPEESVEGGATVVFLDAYQRCRGLASIFEQLTEYWTPPPVPKPNAVPRLLYLLAAIDESPISRPQTPEPPVP